MLLHATGVAIGDEGVLLCGPAGCGKSDMALRLIDDGAILVADDQVRLQVDGDSLIASVPERIAGLLEVRHIGLISMPHRDSAPVILYVELMPLAATLERLPEADRILLLDCPVRRLRLPAYAASTPAKIRAALKYSLVTDNA